MKLGGVTSVYPIEGQPDWRTASELLEMGQYARGAEILRQAQTDSRQTGDTVLAHLLAVAYHMCLACNECRAEVERHRQACQEADQRERELRQEIHAVLDLANGLDPLGTPEKRESSPTPSTAVDVRPPRRNPSQPAERLSLWQRIQVLLAHKMGPRAHKRDVVPFPPTKKEKQGEQTRPSLVVYCLGPFRVYQDGQSVQDWPSGKGKAAFKYLVTHREHPTPKEVLMELFWPGVSPDAARNNLNVAIYGLRQLLRQSRPSFSHVLFRDGCYLLNPDLHIWVDWEAFIEHMTAGQVLERRKELTPAMREYQAAEALYQGEFLEEDRYEDWLIPQRQYLQDAYLGLLERLSRYYLDQNEYSACAALCRKMLAVDSCCEEAHRRLMCCYSRQEQSHLALRQYHLCVERLKEELGISASQTTTALYEQIRTGKRI